MRTLDRSGVAKAAARHLAPFLLALLLLPATATAAEWVDHEHVGVGSGTWSSAVGGDAVAVTRTTGARILFFSALDGEWVEHLCDPPLAVVATLAEESLALVVGADRAVVFDARTGQKYEQALTGTLLSTSGDTRSFACGRDLALVVTDETMHVFDAELGTWRTEAVDTGSPAFTSRHQVHDTYAASFLPQTSGDPINLVYSLPRHAFNATAQGIHAPVPAMTYGYAGLCSRYDGDDLLVGYNATTNTFIYELAPDNNARRVTDDGPGVADRITTYVLSWEGPPGGEIRYHNIRAFDTRQDCWLSELLVFDDPEEAIEAGPWVRGGEICVNEVSNGGEAPCAYLVYDGAEHTLSSVNLGLDREATWRGFVGGRVMAALQNATAVGFCPPDASNPNHFMTYAEFHRSCVGQDFVHLSRHDTDGDMMALYWYHGPSNCWTSTVSGYANSEGDNTAHVHTLVTGDPQREIIFYSSYVHTLQEIDAAGLPALSYGAGDHLGYAYNNAESVGVLFDAHRGTCAQVNWPLMPGDRVCLATDEAAGYVHAYSVNTGQWSDLPVTAPCTFVGVGDLVGLFRQGATQTYHGLDGSDGSWATLEAVGVYVTRLTGERTALVLTNQHAYALGTGVMVAVDPGTLEPEVPELVAHSALTSIFPNPCNPRTEVAFELAFRQPVRLSIHDLRGRCVRTLVDGELPAGPHQRDWDGRDTAGRAVASGVYLVHLVAEDRLDSRKLLLAR